MNYPRSNPGLQRMKNTHFYRFCVGNKPTHINRTSPYSLYRSTPCDMSSLKNAYKNKYRFSIKPGHILIEYDPPDIFINTVKHSETFPMWKKEEVQHVLRVNNSNVLNALAQLQSRRLLKFVKFHSFALVRRFFWPFIKDHQGKEDS